MFPAAPLVMDTAEPVNTWEDKYSPTTPALAESLVAVPMMPPVVGEKVTDVAVAAPKIGVTNVGVVAKTLTPVPVLSVRAEERLAEDGVARNVATFVPRPETPVPIGRPVQLVNVPELGVPSIGVTKVGEVAKTALPVPVLVVSAVKRLAELGVVRNVDTPAPKFDTPDAIGKPVQLVRVPEAGVPKIGAVNVGLVSVLIVVGVVPVRTILVPATNSALSEVQLT